MSRCDNESISRVALMPKLKKLAELANESKRHEYGYVPVTVRVVDIRRRLLFPAQLAEFPELGRLYRYYTVAGNLFLNYVVVCDFQYQFVNLVINPRFNRELDQLKVKCGDIIKLTNYGARMIPGINLFYEICGYELCVSSKTYDDWSSWQYSLHTTKEVGEAIDGISEHCAIQRSIKVHFWNESVPLWPAFIPRTQDAPDKATSAEAVARFCGHAEIASIYENAGTVKDPFPNLVCRIRARGNHEFYRSNSLETIFPIKINLSVYDNTGGCLVVIWNEALSEEQSSLLREGAVIMLRSYDVRMDLSNSKYKVDFGDLRRFPMELHVQDERLFGKKSIEVVSPEFLDRPDCSRHLPFVSQPCNSFPDITARVSTRYNANLLEGETFPVAGVVMGLSRYYRIRREVSTINATLVGRFYTSRWVELYDPKSDLHLNVEVFVNKQDDDFAALEVGDVAALTSVRLVYRKASNIKEDMTYVTSTQFTELFVMQKREPVDVPHEEIPPAVRKEMRRIKIKAGELRDLEDSMWLGGAHQFVNTYYNNQAINKLFTTKEKAFGDLSQFLKGLAFWESKNLMFTGQIVLVEFCTPETTSCERLLERNGKIQQTSNVIAKASFWDAMKEVVPVYGATCPHYLTLPIKFAERRRKLLHESLRFPRTNIYELESQLDTAENEGTIDEHFQVLSRGYYRIVVLRHDKKVAVSSFFLPMISKHLPTLAQSLHLSHVPLRKPLESPVIRNMEYSESAIRECALTASSVLGRNVEAILQARCMGYGDYEILFCQLYFKNSEDECLY